MGSVAVVPRVNTRSSARSFRLGQIEDGTIHEQQDRGHDQHKDETIQVMFLDLLQEKVTVSSSRPKEWKGINDRSVFVWFASRDNIDTRVQRALGAGPAFWGPKWKAMKSMPVGERQKSAASADLSAIKEVLPNIAPVSAMPPEAAELVNGLNAVLTSFAQSFAKNPLGAPPQGPRQGN